jgi:hypothetical protein
MSINVTEIATKMLAAIRKVFTKNWPKVEDYAETECKKLAETLAMIEKLRLQGKITEEEAKLQLQIQKNAARAVLLTLEGMGVLAAEEAINAALEVVGEAINAALGFTLI